MRALAVILVLALAGCVTPAAIDTASVAKDGGLTTARGWSMPTSPAPYGVLEGVQAMVPSFDGVEIAVGLFLPDIDGCDWSATELPETCRIPAVMDAGPYYGTGVDAEKFRPPVTEWLVPRGYASLQMSLRGTGESGGCLEYKNPTDVEDVSAVVDWIAAQPWSNGNVGMIGRSYDGTSAWAGAASGNPHLKTVVPISGAVNGPHLYFKNGTAETRAPLNGATYFPTYATDAIGPTDYPQRLCQGALVDVHRESALSTLTGDASSEYWQARDLRPRILESYQGSVWVIHGLQDWNVNPSQVVPLINEMQDAGIETSAWLGVWGHAYPDRVDEHRNVRWDWADRVVAWFDKHLKGADVDTGPAVEVEDSLFVWRAEESYPPRDAVWVEHATTGGAFAKGGSASWTSEPLADDLRIAGLVQLHVDVTPTTARGGYLAAELYDVWPDGRTYRLGWGVIDLPHHAGGNGAPDALTPGQPVTAMMEFEPLDAHVGLGHSLRVVFHKGPIEDVIESPSPELIVVGDGVLRLPSVERPDLPVVYAPAGL